jgi:hypothetical protein
MCRHCEAERLYLISIEELAVRCSQTDSLDALVLAIALEESDQETARHLTFLKLDLEDDGEDPEDILIGRVFMQVLAVKARLQ